MRRVVRSPRASEDLIELWTHIAADNPSAADRMLDRIEAKLRLLAATPKLGPARPDIAEGLRLFPIKRYVVLYRELPDGIEVVRVVHGMRRLDEPE
ncbi:MAG: type II toxin-antitoxin system RelE/ParE family toxin [Geminicoccaceae bacterium]